MSVISIQLKSSYESYLIRQAKEIVGGISPDEANRLKERIIAHRYFFEPKHPHLYQEVIRLLKEKVQCVS